MSISSVLPRPPSTRWEYIAERTYRLKVPGGWLYRVDAESFGNSAPRPSSLCFVPEPA